MNKIAVAQRSVSVVMCTYNGAPYLREQLDSILHQTYPVFELIIQDDCSTDGTWEILGEYAEKYPCVHIFRNAKNEGVNRNFFSAIKKATGDFVAISDQDDIWELDKLQTQVAGIGDNMLSFGFSRPFASGNNVCLHFDKRVPNYTAERMLYMGAVPGHTILVRRSFLELFFKLPAFANSSVTYDRLLSLLAASYGRVQFCNKVLVQHRCHIHSATYTPPYSYRKSILNIVKSVMRTFRLYRELRPQMRERFRELYLVLKSLPEEASCGKDACRLAYLHSQSSFGAYVRLTFLCVKLRHRIFHAAENDSLLTIFRAMYFPVSCSDYFRYLSRTYHK